MELRNLYPGVSEEVLSFVYGNAESFARAYCNTPHEGSLSAVIPLMVQEDLNHLGAEGLLSESVAGNSIAYLNDYSPKIYRLLNQHKKIKTVM